MIGQLSFASFVGVFDVVVVVSSLLRREKTFVQGAEGGCVGGRISCFCHYRHHLV